MNKKEAQLLRPGIDKVYCNLNRGGCFAAGQEYAIAKVNANGDSIWLMCNGAKNENDAHMVEPETITLVQVKFTSEEIASARSITDFSLDDLLK